MVDVAGTRLNKADIELIGQMQVGGIILFARNVQSPEQVRELCDAIRQVKRQSISQKSTHQETVNETIINETTVNETTINQQILVAVDQEGGRVARLQEGFSPLPAMGAIGQRFETDPCHALRLAYHAGYLMAAEVLAVGIDFSFAPVLDLNGISQVIGDRSFHAKPQVVTALAGEFIHGMKSAGMASTGKHFPGHGSVAPDSHVAMAVDDRCYDDIANQDLLPFMRHLPWLDALMPAHVIFSQVDDRPAGFSRIWLQQIIRQKLGFDGVLFSDDLSMKAAHVAGDVTKRVQAAISAGCDMALVCNDAQSAMQAAQFATCLPMPNQSRLANMAGNIPVWQGCLASTAAQLPLYLDAKASIADFMASLTS